MITTGIPADIGSKINPKPVIDKHMEANVAPIFLILSTDYKIVLTVL